MRLDIIWTVNFPRPSQDRTLGCLLGGAIGDAWGSASEGAAAGEHKERPWQFTDDTQLTIATCEALLEVGQVLPERIAAWFVEGRLTGVGASTLQSLRDLSFSAHWALAGARSERAAGNGAAMRIVPLAFVLDPSDIGAREVIRDVCRITHHPDEAYASALAVVLAVQDALAGQRLRLSEIAPHLPDSQVRDRLRKLADESNLSIYAAASPYGTSGFVAESVPLALLAASPGRQLGVEEVLTQVITAGGDTDTVASIAGQVMGAALGYGGLPKGLLAQLPSLRGLAVFSKFAEWIETRPPG